MITVRVLGFSATKNPDFFFMIPDDQMLAILRLSLRVSKEALEVFEGQILSAIDVRDSMKDSIQQLEAQIKAILNKQ